MMETLQEITTLVNGIVAFFDKISSFTSFIGLSTVLLFLGVLLLSAGFSVIGVPRGKASFLLSLAASDALWIAWEQSFNPGHYEYLPSLAKSNILILAPLVIVTVVAFLFPRAGDVLRRATRALMKNPRMSFSKSDMLELFEEYQFSRTDLERHLLQDISRSGNEPVSLSPDTIRSARALQKTVQRLAADETPKKS